MARNATVRPREAYATICYGHTPGAEPALASLRRVDTERTIVILTPDGADSDDGDDGAAGAAERAALRRRFAPLRLVRVAGLRGTGCRAGDIARFARMRNTSVERAELVFSSFHAFNLTRYERVVWFELDQLVLQPLSALWRLPLPPTAAAAAASVLTEGCVGGTEYGGDGRAGDWTPARARKYNTGVVLLRPDAERFGELVGALGGGGGAAGEGAGAYACRDGSQTLWNRVLAKRVVCLHHSFNCLEHGGDAAFGSRCLLPSAATPHVVHFAGASKPWLDAPRRACRSVGCRAWLSFVSRNRSFF